MYDFVWQEYSPNQRRPLRPGKDACQNICELVRDNMIRQEKPPIEKGR